MTKKKIIYIFIFLLILSSCTKEKNIANSMGDNKNIPQEKWDTLASKKIYFGHQSVGFNMIDGIEMILKENPNIKINIIEGDGLTLFENPVFAHSKNGQNIDPKSKIDAFYNIMIKGLGNNIDIAGFKFCYIDFKENTDIDEIFKYYKQRMNEISSKYPNIIIIHYTVPLRTIQSGPKAFIKKILGKSIGIEDNIARQQFNTLLIDEFGGQPIFDLAKFESTYGNGKREFTEVNNEKIFSMVPAYTNDGGHLSKKGKYYIGTKFLIFLLKVSNGR